jgi:formate dehydrogenase major subunit
LEHYNCGAQTRRTGNADILLTDTLMIHPDDAAKHQIQEGDWVCVESARGKIDVTARITDEVKPGILSSTFHFPEISMNVLTSSVTDTDALCPEYKVCAVRIRKSKGKQKAMAEALTQR